MKSNVKPLIVANWKMNPVTLFEAKQIFVGIRKAAKRYEEVSVVVAPPTIFLLEMARLSPSRAVLMGAQNIHGELKGAYTGEISAGMLSSIGTEYVIVGHSERRATGESDEDVKLKINSALKAKLIPIVCVGERERDNQGNFYNLVEKQIQAALVDVPKARFKNVVIAYEPIWAIGTGVNATVEDVQEMKLFIRKVLTKYFGRSAAAQVKVLYGGSVTAENSKSLFEQGEVDGFLVGGASLRVEEFTKIIASTI